MSRSTALLIGAVIGAVGAAAYAWLLGPAKGTTYDSNYSSRLDYALDEGKRAAAAKEEDLMRTYRIDRARKAGE